jgi:hypothetical protein
VTQQLQRAQALLKEQKIAKQLQKLVRKLIPNMQLLAQPHKQ